MFRNGAWADGMEVGVGGSWVEDKPAPWMDQAPSWQSGPKHKPGWDGDDPSSWAHKQVLVCIKCNLNCRYQIVK